MIDQRRRAAAQGSDRADLPARLDTLERVSSIQSPPNQLQNLVKIPRQRAAAPACLQPAPSTNVCARSQAPASIQRRHTPRFHRQASQRRPAQRQQFSRRPLEEFRAQPSADQAGRATHHGKKSSWRNLTRRHRGHREDVGKIVQQKRAAHALVNRIRQVKTRLLRSVSYCTPWLKNNYSK